MATAGGSMLVFGYFVQYRYSPIDSLSGLGAVVALVAALALLLGSTLFAMWTYPGWLFWGLSTSGAIDDLRRLLGLTEPAPGPSQRKPWQRRLRPVGLGIAWVVLPWTSLFAFVMPHLFGGDSHRVLGVALAVASVLLWGWLLWSGPGGWEFGGRLCVAAVAVVLLVGPIYAFLQLVTLGDAGRVSDEVQARWLILAAAALVATANVAQGWWVLHTRHSAVARWVGQAAVLGVSFLLLVVGVGAGGALLDSVMTAASVRIPAVRIALSGEACEALDAMTGSSGSSGSAEAAGGERKPCVLSNVLVVSRIGERWRLGCRQNDRAGVTLLAEHVQAWSAAESDAAWDPRIEKLCAAAVPPAK